MLVESLVCAGCGEGLNPMMSVCPRCGQELKRKAAKSADEASSGKESAFAVAQQTTAADKKNIREEPELKPLFVPILPAQTEAKVAPMRAQPELVMLSPEPKPARFPRFTQAQVMLLVAGGGLLIFLAIVGLLLRHQQQREQARIDQIRAQEQALLYSTATIPTPDLSVIPAAPLLDDKALAETVRAALSAYNPVAAVTRYRFSVKDGIVTLDGYALNEPEKKGAENVIRLISGIRMLCSSLFVAPETKPEPVMVRVNEAEARRLDEAVLRQIVEEQKRAEEATAQAPPPPATPDPQREAEKLRREQELARLREEEAALRRQEEERLKQEAAEYERQREELRRAEADRQARARQVGQDTGLLRSGTVAWSGFVEGVDEIIISGSSASVRHLSGDSVREARASFSAPVPRLPVNIKLLSSGGRGSITVVQEPSAANGYTTIVRVDDSGKGGDKRYEFTLRWSAQ